VAYGIAAIPMTLSDVQGHSSIASLQIGFSYSFGAADNISTNLQYLRGPSAIVEPLVSSTVMVQAFLTVSHALSRFPIRRPVLSMRYLTGYTTTTGFSSRQR